MRRILCFLVLVVILPLIVVGSVLQNTMLNAATAENVVKVTVTVNLSGDYKIWGIGYNTANVTVELWINAPKSPLVNVSVPYPYGNISLPEGARYVIYFPIVLISVPSNLSYARIFVPCTTTELCVAYRNFFYLSDVPTISISGLGSYRCLTTLIVNIPQGAMLVPYYPAATAGYRVEENQLIFEETEIFRTGKVISGVIAYQPSSYLEVALSLACVLIALPILIMVFLRDKVDKLVKSISSFSFIHRLATILKKCNLIRIGLVCCIISAFLMLSIAVAIGPHPSSTVLIFADQDTSTQLMSSITHSFPQVNVYSSRESYGVWNALGFSQVDLIIIGDFYVNPWLVDMIERLYHQGSDLCVLEEFNQTALSKTLIQLYENYVQGPRDGTFQVLRIDALNILIESEIAERQVAGRIFNLPADHYGAAVEVLASLSIVLAFFASLSAVALATSGEKGSVLKDLLTNIVAIVIFFVGTTAIYIGVSSITRLPICAHAVGRTGYGSPLIGMGYLGFGGGTTLRFAAGVLGASFVIFLNHVKGVQRIKFEMLPLALGVFLLFLLLPVLSPHMDDFLIAWFGAETAATTGLHTMGFFSEIIISYTQVLAPVIVNRGMTMYLFAGVLIWAAKFFKQGFRTLILISASLFFARGLTRVGNLDPYTFVVNIVPGILLGLLFVAVLIVLERLILRVKTLAS